jgi:tetratricopeptide (TPR) repeat protein
MQKNLVDYNAIYNKAIYESPRNPWLYNNFAAGLTSVNQFDQAIQNARRAVASLPSTEFQATLAEALIKKAEALYFQTPGIPTSDPNTLNTAEALSLECLKYSRSHIMAYRIAGHASFLKALAGDYGSLIATQSYFAKALEMEPSDSWVAERYQAANQALASGASVASIWSAQNAAKSRVPAQQPQAPKK